MILLIVELGSCTGMTLTQFVRCSGTALIIVCWSQCSAWLLRIPKSIQQNLFLLNPSLQLAVPSLAPRSELLDCHHLTLEISIQKVENNGYLQQRSISGVRKLFRILTIISQGWRYLNPYFCTLPVMKLSLPSIPRKFCLSIAWFDTYLHEVLRNLLLSHTNAVQLHLDSYLFQENLHQRRYIQSHETEPSKPNQKYHRINFSERRPHYIHVVFCRFTLANLDTSSVTSTF